MDPVVAPPQTANVAASPIQPQMPVQQSDPSNAQVQPQQAPVPLDPNSRTPPTHPVTSAIHGWHALMGNSTQYVQGPDGPQAVQVPNKPGQLFRSILAGAIMGAGAGGQGNPEGGFWGGASRGVSAANQGFQQQQQRQQQQAQQEFQNKMAADKERREATAADTEQLVRKAQITQANAETLKTNLLTQGSSYDLHQRVADADKARLATYTDAGVKPVFSDIGESEMNDIMKNRPGASSLDWRHTGVKTTVDANGNPSYEYTLSAYDPQSNLPLSKATIDQWDKDGLFKYHPEYKDIAQPGKNLSVGQFIALDKQAQDYGGQQLAQTKNDLEVKHIQAQIDEAHSAINEHNAQTGLAGLNIQEKREAMNEKKTLDLAWEHLATVGNDPDKLTNSHDKVALARAAQIPMQETLAAIKDAQANSTTDKDAADSLPGLWGRYNTLNKLASLGQGAAAPTVQPVTFINPQGQQVIAKTQAQIDQATKLGYTKAGQAPSGQTPVPTIGDAANLLVVNPAKKLVHALTPNSPSPSFPIPTR